MTATVREHHGCAYHSRRREEPQLGTASGVARWLLVEQPGPWGPDAPTTSGLPATVAAELVGSAREIGARPLLIRRPGGAVARERAAFLVATDHHDRRAERVWFDDPAQLLGLELGRWRRGERLGETVVEPLVLVCTNGRHDSCCAVEGRPVARAAAEVLGDAVWECSHIGGDRFAANLLWLPAGVYYGRVEPWEMAALADGIRAGRLSLPHLRGRVPYPFPVQAAEGSLRVELGLDELDAVRVVSYADLEPGRVEVVLAAVGEQWRLVVAVDREREAHLLTCRASRAVRAPTYQVVERRPLR